MINFDLCANIKNPKALALKNPQLLYFFRTIEDMKVNSQRTFLLICLIVLGFSMQFAGAQTPTTSDCLGATPVCNSTYDVPVLNPQPNNFPNEINASLSCLNGETNGQWYVFTVQSGGLLGFNIIPYTSTSDYDWALFDLSNFDCSDIASNAALEVICNFSAQTTNNGITGANGQLGDQNEAMLPVVQGQTFALYISNYSFGQNQSGYQLDFSISTAAVPDNTAPSVEKVTPSAACKAQRLEIEFSENIDCASVQASDFQVTGPNGVVAVASIFSADCAAGASYSRTFELILVAPLTGSGQFSVQVVGSISDVCGNALSGAPPFDFNYVSIVLNMASTDSQCPVDDGTASVAVAGGVPPYSYAWNDPAAQSTSTATGLPRGFYAVTVTDAQGCSATDSVYVGDPTAFVLQIASVNDTCYQGFGRFQIIPVGPTAPFNYIWNDTVPGTDVLSNLIGGQWVKVQVIDANGCKRDTLLQVGVELNDSLTAFFTVDNDVVDFLTPQVSFNNASLYESSIFWDMDDGSSYVLPSFTHSFDSIGKFEVTLYAYDRNGCVDTFTQVIEVDYHFSLFVPSAFTPNADGKNERFMVTGVGLNPTTFHMWIFDRWGQAIYQTDNMMFGWDGSWHGSGPGEAPAGVYAYKIEVDEMDGTSRDFLGKVVLIR
jgi:gliding motility-associated-like protein